MLARDSYESPCIANVGDFPIIGEVRYNVGNTKFDSIQMDG